MELKNDAPYKISPPVWRRITFSETIRSVWYHSDMELLTGDPDSCLAALGCSQVTPGDAQTPVILWAMKVLHLLTWHVDHHLADLQPCRRDGGLLRLAFTISLINQRDEDLWGQDKERNLNLIRLSAVNRSTICQEEMEERLLVSAKHFRDFVWTTAQTLHSCSQM